MPTAATDSRREALAGGQGVAAQVGDLLLMELTNWRWSWRSMLVIGALAPVLSTLALGVFARDAGPEALGYVLTGNLVVSLLFGNMGNVQSHFSFMRFRGTLDYLATLPVRREALILAVVVSFLLLSLPSLVVTLVVGTIYLGVRLQPSPLLLLVVPLAASSLSGVGALLGVTARTPQEGGALAHVLTLLLAAVGPVVVPPERLGPVLLLLGRLNPATYAASALRQALLGPVTPRIALDLAVLAAVAAALLWWAGRHMDWRLTP